MDANKPQDAFDVDDYRIGMVVEHKKFGLGMLKEVASVGEHVTLTIDFARHGVKRLRSQFVRVRR